MPGVVRTNKDKHVGHASPTPNPFHQTAYKSGSPDVYTNNEKTVRIGDTTECGDPAEAGSPDVYAQQHKSVEKVMHRDTEVSTKHRL